MRIVESPEVWPRGQERIKELRQSSGQPQYRHYLPPRNIRPRSTNVSNSSSTTAFFWADSSGMGGDRSSFRREKRNWSAMVKQEDDNNSNLFRDRDLKLPKALKIKL